MISGEVGDAGASKRFLILKEQWRLVHELCHFTEDLNPLWQTPVLQKQLKALSDPIVKRVAGMESEEEKFKGLVDFFFNNLAFRLAPANGSNLQNCFLPYVRTSKTGPASLLMLLFSSLLEECNLKVQVSSCHPKHLLKVQMGNRSHIADFEDNCRFLQPYEIVELINNGFDFSNGAKDANILVIEYLNLLKDLSRQENKLQILSMTHSYLMRYQPFNLKHLSERALVAYETGDYRSAIDDIRSYFQYKQPEFTNQQLKRIYKQAMKLHNRRDEPTPEL